MSIIGQLIRAGIQSDGSNIIIPRGNITARNLFPPKGTVYYVDGAVTASGNGTSWARAYKTIAEVIAVCNAKIDWAGTPWAESDWIVLAPGSYAENLTSLPYGCHMIGAGWSDFKDAQIGARIAPAAGSPVNVGACINATFTNIGFHSATTYAAFDADILNNVRFDNCYFTGPVETSTGAAGIVTKDSVNLEVVNSHFSCLDKGIDVNYADGGDSFCHALIQNCRFDQIDTCGIEISSNLVGPSSWVIDCFFAGGGVTMATGISDASALLDLVRCYFKATDPVNGCRSANACYGNGTLLNGSGE